MADDIAESTDEGSEGNGAAEKDSRANAAFQKVLQIGSVIVAKIENASRVPNTPKKPPKKQEASVISEQLRDELIRILQTGDAKQEGAFTVAVAAHVEKFTVAAREILMTENLAQNDLASLMMMRKQQLGGPWNSILGEQGYGGGLLPFQTTSSPINNENFGVQAIRQVVEAFRTMHESPAKLVEALAVARENNLPDVVAALEKKLGVSKSEEADEGTEGPDLEGRPLQ